LNDNKTRTSDALTQLLHALDRLRERRLQRLQCRLASADFAGQKVLQCAAAPCVVHRLAAELQELQHEAMTHDMVRVQQSRAEQSNSNSHVNINSNSNSTRLNQCRT
jgi:hypothetical protein